MLPKCLTDFADSFLYKGLELCRNIWEHPVQLLQRVQSIRQKQSNRGTLVIAIALYHCYQVFGLRPSLPQQHLSWETNQQLSPDKEATLQAISTLST